MTREGKWKVLEREGRDEKGGERKRIIIKNKKNSPAIEDMGVGTKR